MSLLPVSMSATPPTANKRSKNFSEQEQVRLANAWILAAQDPSTGVGQCGEDFWRKVELHFNDGVDPGSETYRKSSSLENHWRDKLHKAILTFHRCYEKARSNDRQGWLDVNYIDEANRVYYETVNKPFKNTAVWKVLRESPRWKHHYAHKIALSKLMEEPSTMDSPLQNIYEEHQTPPPDKSNVLQARPVMLPLESGLNDDEEQDADNLAYVQREKLKSQDVGLPSRKSGSFSDHIAFELFRDSPTDEKSLRFFNLKREEYLIDAEIALVKKRRLLKRLLEEEQRSVRVDDPNLSVEWMEVEGAGAESAKQQES